MEILDSLSDDEKSSVFWLTYTDHRNNLVQTEKKVWIQHFAVDKETNTGKTDFDFKIRLVEKPSIELRDWMRNDLITELWETRPRIIEKK